MPYKAVKNYQFKITSIVEFKNLSRQKLSVLTFLILFNSDLIYPFMSIMTGLLMARPQIQCLRPAVERPAVVLCVLQLPIRSGRQGPTRAGFAGLTHIFRVA